MEGRKLKRQNSNDSSLSDETLKCAWDLFYEAEDKSTSALNAQIRENCAVTNLSPKINFSTQQQNNFSIIDIEQPVLPERDIHNNTNNNYYNIIYKLSEQTNENEIQMENNNTEFLFKKNKPKSEVDFDPNFSSSPISRSNSQLASVSSEVEEIQINKSLSNSLDEDDLSIDCELLYEEQIKDLEIEAFDRKFNIANDKQIPMPMALNDYFFVIRVFENQYSNTYHKPKTIFCIRCTDKDFYFYFNNQKRIREGKIADAQLCLDFPNKINYEYISSILEHYKCYKIELQGIWSQSPVASNDVIFANSQVYDPIKGRYIINMQSSPPSIANFIVIEAENPMTPSTIKSGLNCLRQEYFANDISIFAERNKSDFVFLIGQIIHALLQQLLIFYEQEKKILLQNGVAYTSPGFKQQIRSKLEVVLIEILRKHSLKIFILGKDYQEIIKVCREYFELLEELIIKFILEKKSINFEQEENSRILEKLDGVEIPILSQTLGIKGQIDLIYSCAVKKYSKNKQAFGSHYGYLSSEMPRGLGNIRRYGNINENSGISNNFIFTPLELKSGRNQISAADRFQVVLYNIMLMELAKKLNLNQMDYSHGLLIYLKRAEFAKTKFYVDENIHEIKLNPIDFAQFLTTRNIMRKQQTKNLEIKPKSNDPPFYLYNMLITIPNSDTEPALCNKCFAKDKCYKYYLNMEQPQLKDSVKSLLEKKNSKKKIKLEYEKAMDIENSSINSNKNPREKDHEINEENELKDFDFHSEKAKLECGSLLREGFLNTEYIVEQKYIDYYKKFLKFLKSEETVKEKNEQQLMGSITSAKEIPIDFKEFEIKNIKETNELEYTLYIEVPEESWILLMQKTSSSYCASSSLNGGSGMGKSNNNNNKNSGKEKDNQTSVIYNPIFASEFPRKVMLYDAVNNLAYKGLLTRKFEDNANKSLTVEISVLKIYTHSKIFFNLALNNKVFIKFNCSSYQTSFFRKYFHGNLYYLVFAKENEKLRRLIIDNKKPEFTSDMDYISQINFTINNFFLYEFNNLNPYQKAALKNILLAKDYCTIEGYPGTGKTTLIILAIRILVKLRKKILISSLTNSALDNILIKLMETDKQIYFCRLGTEEKVNSLLESSYINSRSLETVEQWKNFYENIEVIGVTTVGLFNDVLEGLSFDFCFIDEAGQIIEYNILGPILLSKTFVLIGDPHQLSPVTVEKNAPESLFKRLIKNNTEFNTKLVIQYRMNEQIQHLSNSIIYFHNLISHDTVKYKTLELDLQQLNKALLTIGNSLNFTCSNYSLAWMLDIFNANRPVVFLNYNNEYFAETNFTNNNINSFEAAVIEIFIQALSLLNYNLQELAVITPFINQEIFLKQKLSHFGIADNVLTIDKSQGIERDLIIISFCKVNKYNQSQHLENLERLNVAFTRAKKKIICIGDFSVLVNYENLRKFLEIFWNNNWIIDFKYPQYL